MRSGGLLQLNHEETGYEDRSGDSTLSKEEVQSNIFMIALAGSRTTSDTVHFSLFKVGWCKILMRPLLPSTKTLQRGAMKPSPRG